MRDPERIREVTRALEECWRECPDIRFGQLMLNIYRMFCSPQTEMWDIEEKEWLIAINKFKEYSKKHYVHKKP